MFYRLSPQLVLRSRWRPYLPRPGERVLVLRTSGGFPPGHPTTRLCLELLPEALAAQPCSAGFQPVMGKRLLDVGCGSGILTLAAAALGVDFCLGVDLSRQAVLLTRENARENGLAAALRLAQGSTECLRGPFDLVLANLRYPVQVAKAPELARLTAPSGTLILSGFRDVQEAELLAAYRDLGWTLSQRLTRDEWAIEVPPEKSYTWVAWRLQRS
jgi:ribosomal protein L11 methyltransferase